MSNIQTGAERMPHDLSHLGFLAGQIGRLITISTTPVIAGDSFEMDAVGALRLSPLRRGLAIDSTVDIFTFTLSAADLPPSPTKSSNLSETAEVPACNVPSRSPLPALAIAPETKLGTASSGLGTLEP